MSDTATISARPVVLVVEDECLQRMFATMVIEDAGYDVIEASSADEAISVLEVRNDIRIVFTDIEMPGSMDGIKLARAVRDRWPPVELILTSGNCHPTKAAIPARGRFLPKPYNPDFLVIAIRNLVS